METCPPRGDMWLCGPQEMTPEPHTGTSRGPCRLVGGSLPGLGVVERWGHFALWSPPGCNALGGTQGTCRGQSLLVAWEGEQSRAWVSWAQVLETSLRWAAPPQKWERRPGTLIKLSQISGLGFLAGRGCGERRQLGHSQPQEPKQTASSPPHPTPPPTPAAEVGRARAG